MSEPFIGQICVFGFNFAPRGWAFCAGQILPIAQNTALFSLLGTTYGGNGQTTFALPDLRGRVSNSMGQGPGLSNYSLGQVSGSESVTLTVNNLAAHGHAVNALDDDATLQLAKGNLLANAPSKIYAAPAAGTTQMAATMIGPTGGNVPVAILQPYLTLNWCIALEGIFPSRN